MEELSHKVAGGCPRCGNLGIAVPEDYTDDTIITCEACDYSAKHIEFYGMGVANDNQADSARTSTE